MFYPDDRIALFIDGPNTYGATREIECMFDFSKVLKHFNPTRAFYYSSVNEDAALKPLLDFLAYNGFTVRAKSDRVYDNRTVRANLGIELAIDAITISERIDHMVIFSGDSDYAPLVAEMQRRGVRVSVFSVLKMTSDELRRVCDEFYDLKDFTVTFGRG